MGWNPFVRIIYFELPTFTQLLCILVFSLSGAKLQGRHLIFSDSTFFFQAPKFQSGCYLSYFIRVANKPMFLQQWYWVQIKWAIVCSIIISMKISWNCRGKDKLQVKWYVWYKSQPQTGGLQPIVVTLTEKTKERMNDLTPSSIHS